MVEMFKLVHNVREVRWFIFDTIARLLLAEQNPPNSCISAHFSTLLAFCS